MDINPFLAGKQTNHAEVAKKGFPPGGRVTFT